RLGNGARLSHNRPVTLRSRTVVAWSLFALSVLLVVLAGALHLATRTGGDWANVAGGALLVVGSLSFPAVGALLVSRRAGGAIGWICIAVGLAVGLVTVTEEYATYALEKHPGTVPGGSYAAWASSWTWM